jgi:aminoglycoside phosphotransferase (APT) family kinase protein
VNADVPAALGRSQTQPVNADVPAARGRATEIVPTWADARDLPLPPVLVLEPLRQVLDAAGLGEGAIVARPIGDGHSNITFLIQRGEECWVLRRPPRPPFAPSTHNVLREYRILAACCGSPVRTPRPVLAVDDATVIGAPFYLMEYVAGEVITTALPAALTAAANGPQIAEELVEALAEIHALDWRAAGLDRLGRPGHYLERQLRRFTGLWEGYRTRSIPAIDIAARRLASTQPTSPKATLVHGDFRLGNTLFARTPPGRLLTVVDWELATIGDPLADVGYLLAMWAEPDDRHGVLLELGAATAEPGFPTRDELAALYARRTGRDVSQLAWYEALAAWKTAVLLEGSYQRMLSGTTSDPFFARLEAGVPELADRALAALDRIER